MMRSMFSGVSGLRVHQTKMDVIANNIANVNTTGYKASRVTFNEVFSQTLSGASGPNAATGRGGTNAMQIGLGVNVASIDLLMNSSAAQRTDGAYDLMIEGEGFFIVGDDTGKYFTRAGAFRLDEVGNLTNYQGLLVMGWQAVQSGPGQYEIARGEVRGINLGGTNAYINPEMTTSIEFEGNLDYADLVGGVKDSTISFYDSLGTPYTMKVRYEYNTDTKVWEMSLGNYMYPNDDRNKGIRVTAEIDSSTADSATGINSASTGVYKLKFTTYKEVAVAPEEGEEPLPTDTLVKSPLDFQKLYMPSENEDSNGAPVSVVFSKTGYVISTAADYIAAYPKKENGDETTLDDVPEGLMSSFSFGVSDLAGRLNPNSKFNDIGVNVDFRKLTQFSGTTDAQAFTLDGCASGTLERVSIGPDGKITGGYTNGRTKLLAQVAVAAFRNPAGLQKVGSNLFTTTPNSGPFDGVGQEARSMLSGSLEMSNVDLSSEFTEMITTQRGFQANSRVITTSDDMLQELVNLKR